MTRTLLESPPVAPSVLIREEGLEQGARSNLEIDPAGPEEGEDNLLLVPVDAAQNSGQGFQGPYYELVDKLKKRSSPTASSEVQSVAALNKQLEADYIYPLAELMSLVGWDNLTLFLNEEGERVRLVRTVEGVPWLDLVRGEDGQSIDDSATLLKVKAILDSLMNQLEPVSKKDAAEGVEPAILSALKEIHDEPENEFIKTRAQFRAKEAEAIAILLGVPIAIIGAIWFPLPTLIAIVMGIVGHSMSTSEEPRTAAEAEEDPESYTDHC